MKLLERIITAILCSILLALLLNNGNGYYMTILLVSFYVFLIGGTITSLVIDNLIGKMNRVRTFHRYIMSLLLYGITGAGIATLFSIFQGSVIEISIMPLFLLGALPGILYFNVLILLSALFKYARSRIAMK
ncbi:hypothetical protein HNR27_000698 [Ornithinibacillus bavariensis]